jgi:D-threo-aldose 1-dehydrogenase
VKLTRLGLGGAPLAGLYRAVGDEAARATVDAAWEHGVRYFDTAPHYGSGLSERRMGAALRPRPRGEYVLSTKVGRLIVEAREADSFHRAKDAFVEGGGVGQRFDFSRDGVLRSLEASLERLGLDRVDIALVHDPDRFMDQALSEALPALISLREQGVVGAVGAGMNAGEPLARIVREADVDVVLVAGRYTLLDRRASEELLPLCAERGVQAIAAGVFNSGILAGGTTFDYAAAPEPLLARARELESVCARYGVPLIAAAAQFPLRHDAVASVLLGMASADEVAANASGMALPIPDALWEALSGIGAAQ